MLISKARAVLRKAGAVTLPAGVKRAVKGRLRGTAWFPETVRKGSSGPARRVFELVLPPAPGETTAPRAWTIDAAAELWVIRLLHEKPLGHYEPYALDAYLTLLEQAPPGAVFDVGANIGLYGMLAAAYGQRQVHCFEPAHDTAQAARELSAANGLAVTVHEVALGDTCGTATLYLSSSTDSSNSLNPDFRGHTGEVVVPLETVDAFVTRTGVVPSVLKVDTETTEHQVLDGAEHLIREHRPWILVEALYGLSEDNLHAVMDKHGYTIYHLDGPGPRAAVERMVGDSTWTYFMFLLAPRPVTDTFWDRMNQWRQALDSVPSPKDRNDHA